MTWNDGSPMLRQICNLTDEEKRILFAHLVKNGGDCIEREILRVLCECGDSTRERIREKIGGCSGTCKSPAHAQAQAQVSQGWCVGRRLSRLEEQQLQANVGGTVDIPTVAGAGGSQTVIVPAYGVEYYIQQFSIDGDMGVATGALSKVQVLITHAGTTLADFRVSQYFKATCCTTIADQFRRRGVCFGYDSKWEVKVINHNALAAETFINGVLSYARGFPTE